MIRNGFLNIVFLFWLFCFWVCFGIFDCSDNSRECSKFKRSLWNIYVGINFFNGNEFIYCIYFISFINRMVCGGMNRCGYVKM